MDDVATEAPTSRPGSPTAPPPLPTTRQPVYRFNWDPSLRRPGPGSVSEATDNRDDAYISPTGKFFPLNNNTSSSNLALPHDWSSSKHGFNAISTVLNNPRVAQAPPKAHSTLPGVPSVELPRVKRKDFDIYLKSIKPEWELFERNLRMGREGAAQLDSTPAAASTGSTSLGLLAEPQSPRTPRTPFPTLGKELPSLQVVPSVYFESSFNLGDTKTFAMVTESYEGDDHDELDPAAIAYSLPLLEKLSHYADVVEQHLVREISLRSSSFFAALTNLHDLQTESQTCLDQVGRLRGMLKEVDERMAKRGLEMVRLEQKLANMDKVNEGVKVVKHVTEMVGVADGLVQAGEWGDALEVIEELEALWEPLSSSEKAPINPRTRIALSQLTAFAALPSHLRELTLQIANSLTSEMAAVLKSDLGIRIEGIQGTEKTNELLRDRLKPLLQNLVRTKGVKAALGSWRELVMSEVRATVKRHLPSSSDVDEEEGGGSKKTLSERSVALAKELREMPHADFLKLMNATYVSLMRCLHGVNTQIQEITALLASMPDSESSPEMEFSDILTSACELANSRATKVLAVRSEQHVQLGLSEFHALFEGTWQFVLACEVLCRKMIVVLRGVIVSQAKAFLSAFHSARVADLAKLVEDEQWVQVEVPASLQRKVELLVNSAIRDPERFILPGPKLDLGAPAATALSQQPLSPPSTPPSGTPPIMSPDKATSNAKQLFVEDRPYFVVSATLKVLVVLLSDYVRLIINLPLLTMDTMGSVIEFLKAFNSRACQVVLGAGAMRSAGLKNITAKHLALASQSLSIGVGLIPYVRETFRRHLSAREAVLLVEFDKVKRDYQEHQNEIHAKLVSIMGDRVNVHCRSLQEINWEIAPSKAGTNAYMEMLVKETVTLHKVLSKYLTGPTVEFVMGQVLAAINHRLSDEYGKIELGSQEAKDRMVMDVRYFYEKLGELKHVGERGTMLETVVLEKAVAGVAPSQSRLNAKLAAVVAGAGVGAERGPVPGE